MILRKLSKISYTSPHMRLLFTKHRSGTDIGRLVACNSDWSVRQHLAQLFSSKSEPQPEKQAKPPAPRRIFSGIQPTGVPHLGNYFGAIRNWVELQESGRYDSLLFCIVDLHSVTVPQDPEVLRQNTLDMAVCLLACGIDPEKCILFKQSAVAEHAELCWLLGCLTTMPRLNHLPAWKEKSETMKEVPLGLFTYPVLQSADILLYKATHVPVGDDQVKHIELCRDLAKIFNKRFGHCFPLPNYVLTENKRIKSLRNPENKMSKSDPDPRGRIDLLDDPDTIRAKLRKAMTDSSSVITYNPEERPGVSNLIELHAAFTDRFPEDLDTELLLTDKVSYKARVGDVIAESLAPVREKAARLRKDPGHVTQVLEKGAERAREQAAQTLSEVKQRMGLS